MAAGDPGPSDAPWVVSVELSDAAAKSLVASQFPDLAAFRARIVSENRHRKTVEVGDRWVFRFPKRSDTAAALEAIIELLPRLGPHLPVPIPEVTFVGRGSAIFPFPFFGYPRLPGVDGRSVRRRRVDVAALGAELAAFLSALHAFPAGDARASGVGTHSTLEDLALLRDRARTAFAAAARELPEDVARRTGAFLTAPGPMPPRWSDRPVLVHNDLGLEHLLIDPSTGALAGVIDWDEAGLGDPAADLAGLWAWLGEPLLDAVLARYAGPLDPGAPARARFAGTCLAVLAVAEGVATERREQVAAAVHTLSFAAAEGVLPAS